MRVRNGIKNHTRSIVDRILSNVDVDASTRETLRNVKLPWYAIKNAITDDDAPTEADSPSSIEEDDEPEAEVYIYDEIGGSFGVSADQFVQDLNAITNKRIAVRINSPGGSVFDSIAIYNALVKHPAHVTTYVDALAASGASIVAMAGDDICMMVGSQLMIHDALGVEMGNAADMQAMSQFLDRQSDNIASIYSNKAGGTDQEWRDLMLKETWMFANEAVEAGLADRVYVKPKQKTDGESMEADVPDEDQPDDAPPEDVPSKEDQSTEEDDDTEDRLEAVMAVRHSLKNFRYAGRKQAPAPSVGNSKKMETVNALRSAFGKVGPRA